MPLLWCGMKGRKTLNYPYPRPHKSFRGWQQQLSVCGQEDAGPGLPAPFPMPELRPGALAAAGPGQRRGRSLGRPRGRNERSALGAQLLPRGARGRCAPPAAVPGQEPPAPLRSPARGQRGGAGGAAGAPPPPVLRAARVPAALPARPRLAALARRGGGCGATAAAASRQARSCPSIGAAISAGTR